ncbi:GNAT family N-acetyltransferase [Microbacterium immunditiarum]|uniref:Putative acetyltransferase n=1 Tax=Microbacterium immunditiarum TaxID=337480 RepID=A0A7Y9KLC6_9MICO|nr:GNAT family N-acetyltransferase [Microbacterium immunditiarum]NYE19599.1 putative acetyltransferase [Microbacterium immunditiarum]
MISLVLPDHARRDSWLAAIDEIDAADLHGFSTFGFDVHELGDPDVFDLWLQREIRQRTEGQDGFVPATVWWIIDDSNPTEVLGSIHLRHELNEVLLAEGGHIGYAVRPSARGRGVATAALKLCLEEARRRGIVKVLVVCETGNSASGRTILAADGVLENVHGTLERYWIELDDGRGGESAA